MKLRLIAVAELPAFVQSPAFQKWSNVPITPLRALSQFHNPQAEEKDIALVVAEDEAGEVLSYMGCLPDRLAAAPEVKMCWCSCWWTHPEKGQGAAIPVFYKALESWKGNMFFDALPPHSIAILERLKFVDFKNIPGVQYNSRFKLAKALPNRIAALKKISLPLKGLDTSLNLFQDLRFRKYQHLPKGIHLNELSEVNEQSKSFIEKHRQKELIGRTAEDLNWILQYPWIDQQAKGQGPFAQKYFFTAHASQFFTRVIQVKKEKAMIAMLLLSYRDGVLTLPYCYAKPEATDVLAKVVLSLLVKWKVDAFVCFQLSLNDALKKLDAPFLQSKAINKVFGIPKKMSHHLEHYPHIQDGDGDVAFT